MNRLIYFALFLAAVATGCSKADELLYTDIARVQLADTSAMSSTFVYEPGSVTRDTVYIQVNTIGNIVNADRPVKLVQVTETGVANPAVAGVHFVPFDDPSLKELMVVKVNAVTAMLPVVLLRDASLKENTYRLRLELAGNDAFGLGETKSRSKAIIFSDRLERFYSWRVDGTQASAFITFGKYSTRKHQFMIDYLGEKIDEGWYQAVLLAGATQHYKNLLKQALANFNANPANVANGTSPMRETTSPGSPLVVFP